MRVSVFLTCLVALRTATAAQQLDLHTVDGKLWLPGMLPVALAIRSRCSKRHFCFIAVFTEQNIKTSKIKLLLSVNGGSQLQSFPKVDGSFTFYAVPSGTHMLDVVSLELVFPQVSYLVAN